MDQLTIHGVGVDKSCTKGQRDTTLTVVDHTINGTAAAAQWLFGILAGDTIDQLVNMEAVSLNDWDLATQMASKECRIASPGNLIGTLQLADFYGICFFPRLMTDVLLKLARRGKVFALASFTVAIQLRELESARFAVKRMKDLPCPLCFDRTTVEAMGAGAWWCLITAWTKACKKTQAELYFDPCPLPRWRGTEAEWKSIAKAISF